MSFQSRSYAAGAAQGFTITPFAAGHLVGGCAWRITTPEDEDIVYAVHYNHRKQACTACMLTLLSLRVPSSFPDPVSSSPKMAFQDKSQQPRA